MRTYVMAIAAVAGLGLVVAPSAGEAKKSSFRQKLGGFAKGVANVGLQVAGRSSPGVGVKKKTFGQKLGGFAKGVAKVGLQVAGSARRVRKKTFGQKLGSFARSARRNVGARMYPYTVANAYRRRKAVRRSRAGKRVRGKANLAKKRTDTAKNSIRNIN